MPSHDLHLRPLSSRLHDTVIVADLRAERIVLWTPAAEALFGYSTAEALELPLERLVPDRLRTHYRDRLIAYRLTGQDPLLDPSGLVELPALCKTGEEIRARSKSDLERVE